jgi:hypothetical protein
MATTAAPPSSRASAPKRPSLRQVLTTGTNLPNRFGLGAVEKFGKTSLAAQMPSPIFIETKGETGLDPLISSGQLKETPRFPEALDWEAVIGAIDELIEMPHDYKTCVIDTVNGAERLCHEYVTRTAYQNDWESFLAYGRGVERSLEQWREFLAKLDRLRIQRKMTIVCLYHLKVKTFKNPEGADYDRYEAEMHQSTWGLTKKWLDVILFGNYSTDVKHVKENKKTGEVKGKSLGGQQRVVYTQRTSAYDAGNRLGLPEDIDMGSSPAEGWANFREALIKAREANK